MKVLVVLSALVACSLANPSGFAYSALAPMGYYGGLGLWGGVAPWGAVGWRNVVAPGVLPLATAGLKSQYHAQNELGHASYGHVEPLQAHHAVQDSFGNKVGSYSYLNPHDGQVHRTDYVADALGYRVAANDLPVAPVAPAVAPVALPVAPEPVVDTPEVAAAKAAHMAELEKAATRNKRSVLLSTPASTAPLLRTVVAQPIVHPIAHPLTYAAAPLVAHSLPVHHPLAHGVVGAHALRDATLTTIVNNPGHAVSYRVD